MNACARTLFLPSRSWKIRLSSVHQVSPINPVFIHTTSQAQLDLDLFPPCIPRSLLLPFDTMGLYKKLPNSITEVDVVIAGGICQISNLPIFEAHCH